ncbi:trypsin-like serine peptidase [Arthrobacter sp. GCM10027362]|uniref:trypsin-like serine peptidase n=1 Tax=Arthrobacter sp. GCM10027362 TaxID=3273379 RepID=UPI00363A924F
MSDIVNGHKPVSNEPEENFSEDVGEPVTESPSEGSGSGAGQLAGDDPVQQVAGGDPVQQVAGEVEAVEGYSRPETVAAKAWMAPAVTGLRDIAEASFGRPQPLAEIVHPPDDRVQINDTSVYPWRVHCSLEITAADSSQWIGTGWFIGPHTVMTAGHVVHIKNSGVPGRDGWVRSIRVMPGRTGSTLPYGSVISQSFRSVNGWINGGDENYDYGAIILPTDLGNTVGWLGFGVYSDADLLASTVHISGYPGDKPAGTQWYASRGIASVNSRKVFYDIDTAGGQSGSGVYRIINGQRHGVAIHAYGGAVTNSGTRIITPVFNNMVAWKA